MAVQGKGILGSPQGKIGSIHCYDRLGQSIIQSNSIPKDAYLRRWNLLKWQLTNQLAFFFDNNLQGWQDIWSNEAPVGSTGREYFINSALYQISSNKLTSVTGSRFRFRSVLPITDIIERGSWLLGEYSVSLIPSSIVRAAGIPIYYRLVFFKNNAIQSSVTKIQQYDSFEPLSFSFTQSFLSDKVFGSLLIYTPSAPVDYGYYNTMFFDKSLF